MIKVFRTLCILLLLSVVTVSCSQSNQTSGKSDEANKSDGVLDIYASIYPIQYVTERIGGDSVSVDTVYPPGADAHTYEPTSKEIITIAKSDAFFYLGAGMEAFAGTAAASLENQDVKLLEIGKDKSIFLKDEHEHGDHEHGVEAHNHDADHEAEHEEDEEHEHHHGDYDPHIWLDPERLIHVSELVTKELIALNPGEKSMYEENLAALKEDLNALDEAFKDVIEKKENKHILVSHAAYGYWEDRYGIEQISVNGLSSSNEPSQKELTNIIKQINKYNLEYILFEKNISNRVSEIVQDEVNAKTAVMHNLEVLTEEDIEKQEDYISLMEQNLEVLDKVMN